MAKIKTTPWTLAIDTPEDVVNYLEAALEDGDPDVIVTMLGYIARSRGMAQIAREAHVSRESLYKSLNGVRKPEFATILKVMGALGVRLRVEAIAKKSRPRRRALRLAS
jgi:probable addiction module antidote protein